MNQNQEALLFTVLFKWIQKVLKQDERNPSFFWSKIILFALKKNLGKVCWKPSAAEVLKVTLPFTRT